MIHSIDERRTKAPNQTMQRTARKPAIHFMTQPRVRVGDHIFIPKQSVFANNPSTAIQAFQVSQSLILCLVRW